MRPKTSRLTVGMEEESLKILPATDSLKACREYHGVCIFHFEAPLYYATKDLFRTEIHKMTAILSTDLDLNTDNFDSDLQTTNRVTESSSTDQPEEHIQTLINAHHLKHVIVDCSAIPFMDSAGVQTLITVANGYSDSGVTLSLAQCTQGVIAQLKCFPKGQALLRQQTFVTIGDAVMHQKLKFDKT